MGPAAEFGRGCVTPGNQPGPRLTLPIGEPHREGYCSAQLFHGAALGWEAYHVVRVTNPQAALAASIQGQRKLSAGN